MENLKEINDQYQWIYRVIESCSTLDQIEGVHNLINRFAEKYPKHTILKDMLRDTAEHRSSVIIDLNQFETQPTEAFFESKRQESNKTEFTAHTTSIGINLTRRLLGLKPIDENGNYVKDEVATRQLPDVVGKTMNEMITDIRRQEKPP